MEAAEAIKLLPMTAWEQSVIVVLFIFMLIGLLSWFGKQSKEWQKFMIEIDEKWRQFSREQREENNAKMADVERSLSDLTLVTQALVDRVDRMCRQCETQAVTRRKRIPKIEEKEKNET